MDALKQILIALLVAAPGLAAACPNCVGQNKNTDVLKVVGAFMLIPFAVFYVVLRAVRRAQRETDIVEK